jgi:hypothetical protein
LVPIETYSRNGISSKTTGQKLTECLKSDGTPLVACASHVPQRTLFDTRALRASLGKRVKPPHADFPLALAGLRNVV